MRCGNTRRDEARRDAVMLGLEYACGDADADVNVQELKIDHRHLVVQIAGRMG